MNAINRYFSFALVIGLVFFAFSTISNAQYSRSQTEVRSLVRRVEVNFDSFKISLNKQLSKNNYRNSSDVEQVKQDTSDLENNIENFKSRFDQNSADRNDVGNMLKSSSNIDDFLRRNHLGGRVDRDWVNLRAVLSDLANQYQINWDWTTGAAQGENRQSPTSDEDNGGYSDSSRRGTIDNNSGNNSRNPPNYPNQNNSRNPQFRARLTGTYQLDTTRSDNPQDVVERRLQNTNAASTERDDLVARLESPDRLALETNGRNVSIASTLSDQVSITADGNEKVEKLDNGETVRVRADLSGERLTIMTSGDRENDYRVTFEPTDNGRSLRVTRELTQSGSNQPIVVQSIYTKTDDVARLDIFNNPNANNNNGRNGNSGNFGIPNDTRLVAVMQNNLSTKTSLDNDRFSMLVQSPSEFRGAVIEGYISNVQRAGRVTGSAKMTFNFQRVRFPDGTTTDFAGFVESLKTTDGKTIKIDNEGTAKGSSQTSKTAKRGALGAGVGAIIGAIAGGPTGAAIGAAIGGGAGAGSVIVQGRDDLELMSGSEVTIRASAPRS